MKLTSGEVELLKGSEHLKLWRFEEPRACEVGCRYSAEEVLYTVVDIRELTRGDVLKLGKGAWDALKDRWLGQSVWCVSVVQGDRTDHPRLLMPSGRAGDGHGYTDLPARAMRDEPEAVSERENAAFALEADAGIVA